MKALALLGMLLLGYAIGQARAACPALANAAYNASAAPIEAEYRRDFDLGVQTAAAVYEAQMVSVRMAYDEAKFECDRVNNNSRRYK